MPETRYELAVARRTALHADKQALHVARQQELDARESLRKLYLEVQMVAARRLHDVSMAEHREWFHSPQTRSSADLPGPGSYSLGSSSAFIDSSKSRIEPLGATASRPAMLSEDAINSPGPAAYILDRYRSGHGTKFTSRPPERAMEVSPGPAAYDLTARSPLARGPTFSQVGPKSDEKESVVPHVYSPQQSAFGGGGKFAVERKEYLLRNERRDQRAADKRFTMPGPGAYSVDKADNLSRSMGSGKKSHKFSTMPRNPQYGTEEMRPGPGAYFPAPTVQRERELQHMRSELLKRELQGGV